MCGIFGYIGKETQVQDILLTGLQRLEYRGYDSAGMAVGLGKEVLLERAVGKVANLSQAMRNHISLSGNRGIAHTRRATHGGVTVENCHPHASNDGSVYVVHNGIIENYAQLKKQLEEK